MTDIVYATTNPGKFSHPYLTDPTFRSSEGVIPVSVGVAPTL